MEAKRNRHREIATDERAAVEFLVPRGHGLPGEIVKVLGELSIRPTIGIVSNEGQKLAMVTRQGIFQGTASMERVLHASREEEPSLEQDRSEAESKQEDTNE